MKLREILRGIEVISIKGDKNIDIKSIHHDSREVVEGSMFIALRGFKTDGHKYIESVLSKNVSALVVEEDIILDNKINCSVIKVENSREIMAKLANNFYNYPSEKLNVVGITGTNGKTSITTLLKDIFDKNSKCGLIGTIKIDDGVNIIESKNTTPESIDIQKVFNNMLDNQCKYCSMEVSSHSLALSRVDEVEFKVGVFTNLTPDHLDFHTSLDDYRDTKEKLFYKTTIGNLINIDDKEGRYIYNNIKDLKTKAYTYAVDQEADFMAKDVELTSQGAKYTLITPSYKEIVEVSIPGKFSVYNSLAIIGVCYILNIDIKVVKEILRNTKGVPGRFENVDNNKGLNVIVDYAHTPDALENILNTANEFVKGRVITVFGCGGNRDSSKRPLMGKIAQDKSNICILTSDNPREESPSKIIEDVLEGMNVELDNYYVKEDRKSAIEYAVSLAQDKDLIIIAGKGHEDYQIIGTTKYHFDDKEVVREAIDKIK